MPGTTRRQQPNRPTRVDERKKQGAVEARKRERQKFSQAEGDDDEIGIGSPTGLRMLAWNAVRLEGYVVRDLDFYYTKSGSPYCKFSLSIYNGKGKKRIFMQVTVWGGLSEDLPNEIGEGDAVLVYGKLTQFRAESGVYYTGIEGSLVQKLEDRKGGANHKWKGKKEEEEDDDLGDLEDHPF